MDKRSALRDWVWYQPEKKGLLENGDMKTFSRVVGNLFAGLDWSHFNRDSILVQAYDYLNGLDFPERSRDLVLALLDGGMALLDEVEGFRTRLIENKQKKVDSMRVEIAGGREEMDEELLQDYQTEIDDLCDSNHEMVYKVLCENDLRVRSNGRNVIVPRNPQPLETAFVINHTDRRRWTSYRQRLAGLFGLTKHQIAAMKAWKQPTLSERSRHGGDVDAIVGELRRADGGEERRKKKEERRTEGAEESRIENRELRINDTPPPGGADRGGAGDVGRRTESRNTECEIRTSGVYGFIPKEAEREFARLSEPSSFQLVNDKVTNEQRRWILTVVMLTPENQKPEVRDEIAKALGTTVKKIGPVTAYLRESFRDKIRPEIRGIIEGVEGRRTQKVERIENLEQGSAVFYTPAPGVRDSGSAEQMERTSESRNTEVETQTSGVYVFIPNQADREFARLREPSSFQLVNGKVTPEQRRWILTVVMLTPEEQKPAVREEIAKALGTTVKKIGPVTAYLRDSFRDRIRPEIRGIIEEVEGRRSKDGERKAQDLNSKIEIRIENGNGFEDDTALDPELVKYRAELLGFLKSTIVRFLVVPQQNLPIESSSAHTLSNRLKNLYTFLDNHEFLRLITELEPPSFRLNNEQLTHGQLTWVLCMGVLTPEGNRSLLSSFIADVFGCDRRIIDQVLLCADEQYRDFSPRKKEITDAVSFIQARAGMKGKS